MDQTDQKKIENVPNFCLLLSRREIRDGPFVPCNKFHLGISPFLLVPVNGRRFLPLRSFFFLFFDAAFFSVLSLFGFGPLRAGQLGEDLAQQIFEI